MKKILIILFFISSINSLNAQKNTDPVSLFKMMLFLDKDNVVFRGMDTNVVKNDSLYDVFRDYYNISFDTLKPNNNLALRDYFQFYRLDIRKLKGNRKLQNNEAQYIGIFTGTMQEYILAMNLETGICYRLQGFRGNDFLMFLTDFKDMYKEKEQKPLSNSTFLKKYNVDGLDFECLYKGLRAKDYDSEKYPCLKRCSDPFKAHAPIR
ncbi:hypothetical protein F0919_02415 [Taibaiella lutea]|uniref:Uncharacterized protein n=1 Tax=Taibaiella lutea TaxID=2608001 RepID=A0A5M6CMV2_9BACT|nr:hypothetical protein [Taibaiella lutea]KAA5536541.1 hypothetical protein F0919_02415 [Taibaiella lutea]